MPKYDYECQACHKVFEVTQSFHDKPLSNCIYCNGKVKRLISASNFLLKGDGWYVTDYPSESRKKALASENTSGAASPGCGSANKETCKACPNSKTTDQTG